MVDPLEIEIEGLVKIVNERMSGNISLENWSSLTCDNSAFYLCLGATESSDVAGISAAGRDPAQMRLTPSADAEGLLLGRAVTAEKVPISPSGVITPVVITRACLRLLALEPEIVDCGTFIKPQVPFIDCHGQPARCVSSGAALSSEMVRNLFDRGQTLGEAVAKEKSNVVIAECVPGGTTTALAVLTALGYQARTAVSSSHPMCNHDAKWSLVSRGLAAVATRTGGDHLPMPALEAIAAVGDPMQAFVLGLATSAARLGCSVMLAGGSQMLAVYALVKQYLGEQSEFLDSIVVATTKWVAFDPFAETSELAHDIDAPLIAACPEFHLSRHKGLQAYESGNIKEGVGAGASMALAFLSGIAVGDLMELIDATYDEITSNEQSLHPSLPVR